MNQPESRTQFEITSFETMHEPDIEDVHKHLFYEILWTDAGRSNHSIDYKEYVLTPRSLFFISPGQIHYFEEWHRLRGGSLLFTEDFFLLRQQKSDTLFELSFLDNFYANPCLELSKRDFTDIRHTIDLLFTEQRRDDASDVILQSLLHVLVAQIQRCVDARAEESISKKYLVLFKHFKRLLDEHFLDGWTSGDYADALHITQHHLNLVVKRLSGATTTEVIRSRSLLEAKRYLTFSDLSVTEVASMLGFFDSSYFAKLFRLEEGLSPLEFKKQMSEKYRKL